MADINYHRYRLINEVFDLDNDLKHAKYRIPVILKEILTQNPTEEELLKLKNLIDEHLTQ